MLLREGLKIIPNINKMFKILKKQFSFVALFALCLQIFAFQTGPVFAAESGSVIINEIAWAGSSDNSNDEWIEMYNPTNQSVDLSGWYIEDDASTKYQITSGSIEAHGYFLIEDSEAAVSNVTADAVIGLSLANAGDSLVLKDNLGNIIDTVNGGGGAWYAGNATDKSSMERIDPAVILDSAANFASAISGNGSKASLGTSILGTPKSVNSTYAGGGAKAYFEVNKNTAYSGDIVSVSTYVSDASDLYAYGFEINYPKEFLSFISAQEADFLKSDGTGTAFNSGLKDSIEGTVIVGNARLKNPPKGLDGSGKLFDLNFKVISTAAGSAEIGFGLNSFLADSQGEVPVKFSGINVSIAEGTGATAKVGDLKLAVGEQRYSFKLSWIKNIDEADLYVIKRKMANQSYVKIGETTDGFFVDDKTLVPNVEYSYQVIAVKNNVESLAAEIKGAENRGIKGDIDRSDRVDGRDILKLAKSYGSEYGDEEYDPLADINFDGVIDGKDLMDVGVNFALSYK